MTTEEAADKLHLHQRHIRYLVRRGAIRGELRGDGPANRRTWVIDTGSVEAYAATPRKPGPKPKTP